jgi:hypothetical protein
MAAHKDDLLRVLSRPEVPLPNNGSESIIRTYVKTRKISASTRSEAAKTLPGPVGHSEEDVPETSSEFLGVAERSSE